jgi:hypothetical protein
LAEPVTHLHAPTPESVVLYLDDVQAPRFTPRELDAVRASLGRSFGQILADQDTDDKFAVLAWLKLRRTGVDIDFDAIRDVVIELHPEAQDVDPTSVVPPTTSPPSATTGE